VCKRHEVEAGTVIARQGDASGSMHFILEGRIAVLVDMGSGNPVRVRNLGRLTTVGEMGLFSGQPRSATLRAEAPSVLYELTRGELRDIEAHEPALGDALRNYIMGVISERLSFASRVISALQR
jgi:SulP family sulfate permease